MIKNVIHLTDMYHPHNDPDDHWDVACEYALFKRKDIHLAGIICDAKCCDFGDPSIMSIAQLNYITRESVPVAIGSSEVIKSMEDLKRVASQPLPASVKRILHTLETMDNVVIHICGSCRDVAIAAYINPDLFRKKCSGIYLNAGSSKPKTKLEWNVWLEPFAYAQIFQIPCKIYWLPCFYESPIFTEHVYGSFYNMPQSEILPYLSENLQKYFLYMFTKDMEHSWLTYLELPLDKAALAKFSKDTRQMYCPPGFFHCAGYGVNMEGDFIDAENQDSVFSFQPVAVQVTDDGMLQSIEQDKQSNIFMLVKKDNTAFCCAMNTAMKHVLLEL